MKGSTYETGLGRAWSGRQGVQRLGEGPSLQVRHGEDERKLVSEPGFSLLRNTLGRGCGGRAEAQKETK